MLKGHFTKIVKREIMTLKRAFKYRYVAWDESGHETYYKVVEKPPLN
jgi:hypothetical protein